MALGLTPATLVYVRRAYINCSVCGEELKYNHEDILPAVGTTVRCTCCGEKLQVTAETCA